MIRRLKRDDIDKVVFLENDVLSTTLGSDMLKSFIESEFSYAFVYDDMGVKGYISCNFDGYDVEILNFCVSSDYQNKGIGRELLNYTLSYFYSKMAISAILEVRESNKRAVHVYELFGFKKINVRKNYYQNEENAIVMQKVFIPFDDVNDAYYDLFVEREYLFDSIRVIDEKEPLKYYHNYYKIDSKTNIDELLKNKFDGFIHFVSNEDLNYKFLDYEISCNAIMHANLYSIKFLKNDNVNVKRLDSSNVISAKNFIFNEEKIFGEKYALGSLRSLIDMDYIYHRLNVYLAYYNDKIVGYLHTFKLDNYAKIDDFFVLDEYQHNGIGQALLKAAIVDLIKNGCSDLIIDTDVNLMGMYRKMGFNQVSQYFRYLKKV